MNDMFQHSEKLGSSLHCQRGAVLCLLNPAQYAPRHRAILSACQARSLQQYGKISAFPQAPVHLCSAHGFCWLLRSPSCGSRARGDRGTPRVLLHCPPCPGPAAPGDLWAGRATAQEEPCTSLQPYVSQAAPEGTRGAAAGAHSLPQPAQSSGAGHGWAGTAESPGTGQDRDDGSALPGVGSKGLSGRNAALPGRGGPGTGCPHTGGMAAPALQGFKGRLGWGRCPCPNWVIFKVPSTPTFSLVL